MSYVAESPRRAVCTLFVLSRFITDSPPTAIWLDRPRTASVHKICLRAEPSQAEHRTSSQDDHHHHHVH